MINAVHQTSARINGELTLLDISVVDGKKQLRTLMHLICEEALGMTWRPIFDNHAIERVRVICAFQPVLRPKFMQRLAAIIEEKRASFDLGPMRETKGQGFVIKLGPSMTPAPAPEQISGWAFLRSLPDGNIVESVALENGTLTYEFAEYTRWTPFFDRMIDLLGDVIREMSTYDDMAALALEYQDRFIFEGHQNKADPRLVLSLGDDLIPGSALDDGSLWHLHRGWFEPSRVGRLLVNQNLDAQDGVFQDQPVRSVAIMTKVEARGTLIDLTSESLTELLPEMHTLSKGVLQSVLRTSTVKMIGMGS